MNNPTTEEQRAPPDPSHKLTLSRREIVSAASAALVAATVGLGAAPAEASSGGSTEGFFLTLGDRVFFIQSNWLRYFEVTELYRQNGHPDAADKFMKYGAAKKVPSAAYYADLADPTETSETLPTTLTFTPLLPPDDTHTYLAMMVSPPTA